MQTFHAVFLREFRKLLDEEVNRNLELLAQGHSIVDYSAYRHHVGIIRGLTKALELCEEAESSANQDK